jgi:hypothetical protein
MLNAAPEKHERMKNRCTLVRAPARSMSASPQSTSAVTPGAWICGTNTSRAAKPISRRRLRTWSRTVVSATSTPYSSTSLRYTRLAV